METQKQKERKEKRESKLLKKLTFDEALTHLLSREAMSKKNVGVMKIFTELSKGHGRMIFCAQNPKVDSSLKDPAFLRATFTKETKKHMSVASDLFPPRLLRYT